MFRLFNHGGENTWDAAHAVLAQCGHDVRLMGFSDPRDRALMLDWCADMTALAAKARETGLSDPDVLYESVMADRGHVTG